MRRIAPLVLSLIVPVMLAACGGDDGGSSTSASALKGWNGGWSRNNTGTSTGTTSGSTTSTSGSTSTSTSTSTTTTASSGPGFPVAGPWMTYYGDASGLDLNRAASTYRIMDIDLDPGTGNFTAANVAALKNNGQKIGRAHV